MTVAELKSTLWSIQSGATRQFSGSALAYDFRTPHQHQQDNPHRLICQRADKETTCTVHVIRLMAELRW